MIETSFDQRVKINQIVQNQLPEFITSESPKTIDFLEQYYISQEFRGGPVDIVENLDQYLKLDNLTQEIIEGSTKLSSDITVSSGIVTVTSTKGFPPSYGLLKIDDEIITYTGLTTNTFTGCVRGFSGITTYHRENHPEELVFSTSKAASHNKNVNVVNLSALFLQEFYKKIKFSLTPGLENSSFVSNLDVGNFIKEARSFYQAKGTPESFRILFNVLFGETPTVLDLETLLVKPSSSKFIRREVVLAELLNSPANPLNLAGQTIKKNLDPTIQGSVSEVEILTRKGKTYYKLSLFVGYDDSNTSVNNFDVQAKTKVLEAVSVGSSIISVDSTIGFGQTGTLVCGNNKILYLDKSVNQFFNCSGVTEGISTSSNIRSDDYVYGYEDGDLTKKVELRLTGVLSKFVPSSDIYFVDENETIRVKSLGESILNPENNQTHKEIFANSWIYNTSSRYQVSNISGTTFTLYSKIDKSSLKLGDNVDILARGTQNVLVSNALVTNINSSVNQITLTNLGTFSPSPSLDYDIRRKIKKVSSSGANVEFGNDKLIADVQNLYVENNDYAYVASNSLPSYTITEQLIESSIPEATGSPSLSALGQGYIQGYSPSTLGYSQISFPSSVSFVNGDAVVYESSNPMPGLVSGETYYVQVLSSNKIKLYLSRSFVGGSAYVEFQPLTAGSGSHNFILEKHKTKVISPQKLLRKFPIQPNLEKSAITAVTPGPIGLLINGVEIQSPQSTDKVYYGPLNSITILNSGKDYDVVNPPNLTISSPTGTGTTALANVVVRGSVKNVFVDPQVFDLNTVVSATISGGNGSGAVLQPIVSRRYRELEFDARPSFAGGGLDLSDETITFKTVHNFSDGEPIVYNANGNPSLGIGTFGPPNLVNNEVQNKTLINGATYYPKVVNTSTVKLYEKFGDYLSGINTIGITTENNNGIHKFRTQEKNTLRSIKVLNSGSGYENRVLRVKPVGISTIDHTVTFTNHNFKNGDLVNYSYTSSGIVGLSTLNNYYVLKVDENTFRLANAGINTTSTVDFDKNKFVKFLSKGSGYNIFKYPDIQVSVNVSFGGTTIREISATPIVLGPIVDVYLYEQGTSYGSNDTINIEKSPKITIKNGKEAEVNPVVKDGRLVQVDVLTGGSEYFSTPSLKITGIGSGAILRPVIENQKLVDVIVINSGIGYTQTDISISVNSTGSGAKFNPNIRSLTVNDQYRFGEELLSGQNKNLQYSWMGYSFNLAQSYFGDSSSQHSPIIGWAYDGNPIYGPYGYSDPENSGSAIRLLNPSYTLNTSGITDRPSGFNNGFFIEDYQFDASGDLDVHNGRFCKTPEFPLGTYAYFVGVSTDLTTGQLKPKYPYFVGKTFRSPVNSSNLLLTQDFDFNKSNLTRNTFPYKVNDQYADNDFLVESNELVNQISIVESVSKGSISSFTVAEPGDNYKVGDSLTFDNNNTGGGGLSAVVSSLTGKQISNISTEYENYNNVVFVWKDQDSVVGYYTPYHQLLDDDRIVVSGLSSSLTPLFGSHQIGVSSDTITLFNNISSNVTPRAIADLYVSQIPQSISVGSSITIENETLQVLNIFPNNTIIRAKRETVAAAHTISTPINILPNFFEIPIKTESFDSKNQDKVFFNPKQSVGIGTTIGASIDVNYTVGVVTTTVSIPVQSIYLPNHPFKTGQEVVLRKYPTATSFIVSNSPTSSTFNLPQSGSSQTVYVINKSKDFIGLTTTVGLTTNTEGLIFTSNGDDDYEYSLESAFDQVTGNVAKIKSTISISTSHGLQNNDTISLEIKPKLSVGIGTSTSVRLKYVNEIGKVVVNPIGFTSAGINTTSDTITILSHDLKTGDKVFYNSYDTIASGLSTGNYFVYKVDDNNIRLAETLKDVNESNVNIINLVSIGGSRHEISLVNPQILSIKNNNLVFDVSDSSLSGKKLKFYYDENFSSEIVGLGNSSSFNIIGVGTVGVSSTASVTLKHSPGLPSIIFYNVEQSGYISTSDTEVKNYFQILFVDSEYTGTYTVSGVGTTTFNISLINKPEKLSYSRLECDILKYTTTSLNAKGGVNAIDINFAGYGYKKSPKFVNITSEEGKNANILLNSDTIGKINKIRILDQGFDYSADRTLRPEASISPFISLSSSNTIIKVNVLSGGKNYSVAPDLIVKNPNANTVVDQSSLKANLNSQSVASVSVIAPIYGLDSVIHEVIAINNSNGVGISSVLSSGSGIITCFLSTPILGFSTNQFNVGDKVLVENVEKASTTGSGFNSSDYNYEFFTVTSYQNTNPAVVEYSVSGLTTNPGIAKTVQSAFASIVNKKNMPEFEVKQDFSKFKLNEQLSSNTGSGFVSRDLFIIESEKEYIKVNGSYVPTKGEILKGNSSGVIATIYNIVSNNGKFNVEYSNRREYGWSEDTGKISESYQVLPDNDYYQNLSYTVKSSIEFDNLVNPVNRLLHSAGLKNFADTQVISKPLVGYSATSTSNDLVVLDISDEKRVDTINNYDLTVDVDTFENKSKYLKLKNKKLTDYIECISNRVLVIDDISRQFSNRGSGLNLYVDVANIENTYYKYLIQVKDANSSDLQVSEVVVLSNDNDIFTLEKSLLSNTDSVLGEVSGIIDEFDFKTLRFVPTDPYNVDYDVKVLESTFNSTTSGINTQSVGFINLTGVNTSVGIATTSNVITINKGKVEALFANIQITNVANNTMNYIELFLDHNGTDTYLSEYYFDTNGGISTNFMGSFIPSINGNDLLLDFYNDEPNEVLIRSKVVGFGTTSVGIGTYRFILPGQIEGNERSAKFESHYTVSVGSTNVVSISTETSSTVKSLVRVSYGNTSSLHQVLMIQDGIDVLTVQYPFLSIGSTSGIGTFGGEFSGSQAILKFYPDSSVTSALQIQSFNEIIYTESDYENIPPDLTYGSITETLPLSGYDSLNGTRANRLDFNATYQQTPIYAKIFNPSDTTQLEPSTGIFSISNHFFSAGERLVYTPGSTFVGVSSVSVGIGSTQNSAGIVTDILPSEVYAIPINSDKFRIATRKDFANAGIYVTFTSFGSGNAHKLEMYKKLEKTILSIDGVVQKPITFTPISYTLSNNNGQVSSASTYFSISGISTLRPKDLLKIDNEYVNIISVGFGTTSTGPITGIGTFPLVETQRGFVGSASTTHLDSTTAQLYRGSFNIVGSKIYFTEAPKGSSRRGNNASNLPFPFSDFGGRVYLRNDYTNNLLFDDLSDKFTGIGKTYTLSVQGINTSGIETGSGVLFINDVFQTPTTTNNDGNNYSVISSVGVSSVIFSGITSSNGSVIISDSDVNQNQLPRGGIIVSLGSTPGLGFAPLVGAKVKAVVGAGGSITSITGVAFTGTGKNVSTAYYDNATGIVEITTIDPHELSGGDLIKLVGLAFTCSSSSGIVSFFPLSGLSGSYGVSGIVSANTFSAFVGYSTLPHIYVGMGTIFPWYNLTYGSGYRNPVSVAITDSSHTGVAATITATVGAGGTLSFAVTGSGSGYSTSTTIINVSDPSYDNLSVTGVSRLGIGTTTDTGNNLLITLDVGASSTTGIGSTLFEVKSFKISRPGYGFKVGDVFKPVGLVTDKNLSSPISEFELTVLDTFTDSFSAWQFGELDYIDSIKTLQDNSRVRFPLYYNSQLLSFEKQASSILDLNAVLLIFVNGVIQEPGVAYQFDGGTSFVFTEAPKPQDDIAIFFYRGTRGSDSVSVNVLETIKTGDLVQVYKNDSYPDTITQNIRRVDNLSGSDLIETNIYNAQGIDETNYKPFHWTKQKVDQVIKGDYVYKSRDSIEPQIYPTARVIKNIDATSTSVFVDDAKFFNYEEDNYGFTINNFNALIIGGSNLVAAGLTAIVSSSGTISSLSITNTGTGYPAGSTLNVKISAPSRIGVGIGTTATATVTVSAAGSITSPIIVNPGFGYTTSRPPQVIIQSPTTIKSSVSAIQNVSGFSGIITGITTTSGTGGHPLALKLFVQSTSGFTGLDTSYPIYVYETGVGLGVTSVDSGDSATVGIGTTFLDNIYYIHNLSSAGTNGEIITNIHSSTSVVGIATTGTISLPSGRFSWGRLYNFSGISTVSIGVTGLTIDSGLSTFPTIQRRAYGLRDTGALRKTSNI